MTAETLSIGALASAVGIPADTLRTWERRYGFPLPERTESGHRRYPRATREKLLRVRTLLQYGYKPSSILGWNLEQLDAEIEARPAPSSGRADCSSTVAELVDAVKEFDGPALSRLLHRSWAEHSALDFLERLCGPLLQTVGEAWARGELTVAHEHHASYYVSEFLASRWRPIAAASSGPIVVCATPAGEHHVMGLHMATLVVAMAGLRVYFLGADVPATDMATTVRKLDAAALVLSVSLSMEPSVTSDELNRIRAAVDGVPIVVGGAGACEHAGVQQLEGLRDALDWAGLLLRRSA